MKKVTSSTENYLEVILMLGGDTHGVKSVEIAKVLKVSKPAVTLATSNLLEDGYIQKVSYGDIKLTPEGAKIAKNVLEKHTFLKNFLLSIGVSEATADEECCEMEHYIRDETFECLQKFCIDHDLNVWIEDAAETDK